MSKFSFETETSAYIDIPLAQQQRSYKPIFSNIMLWLLSG